MGRLKGNLTESQVSEYTIKSLKENPVGVIQYPILEFDDEALKLLSDGVAETLKYSKCVPKGGWLYRNAKRTLDIVLSALGLILLSPVMGITALAIYLDDGGAPIFSQIRVTKSGKMFRMYKFRSMCIEAEEQFAEVQKRNESEGLAFKAKDDPRITRIGRFIRKTSIDELPQLWNILKGDMSIVGIRPPLPREVVLYTPHEIDRLHVKAGLGTMAQAAGRSSLPFDAWTDMDIEYIENRSLWMDTKIFFKMILAVLRRKGAL